MTDARMTCTTTAERRPTPYQAVERPSPGPAVRETAQGTWFLPADGPGSLLRLPSDADASAVRRIRRLELPGLMPIATVLEDDGRVWVATPVPSGPTVDDLLATAAISAWGRATPRRCSARSGGRCGRCTCGASGTARSTPPRS